MSHVNCPHCDASLKVTAKVAGKNVKCPKCGGTFRCGGAPAQSAGPSVRIECPNCSAVLKVKPEMVGRAVKCSQCRIPFASEPMIQHSAPAAPSDEAEFGLSGPPAGSCPECGTAMEDGAILCVGCGYHMGMGHRLGANGGGAPDEDMDTGGNGGIMATITGLSPWTIFAVVSGIWIAFSVIVSLSPPLFVAYFLVLRVYWTVILILIYIAAFQESTLHGLLCIFTPYILYYVLAEMNNGTVRALWGAGVVGSGAFIMSLFGFIASP